MKASKEVSALGINEIWAVDFEFVAILGERPRPICLVALELCSGRLIRLWADEFGEMPPYSVGPDSTMVAFSATAELTCHLALGWPVPEHVLDLSAEFRGLTNGRPTPAGRSLLGALAYFGLDAISATEKDEMRNLAASGGPYSPSERRALLDYCQTDVDALNRLWNVMGARLDVARALLRGRYLRAAAAMEHRGIPIDRSTYLDLLEHWDALQEALIDGIDTDFGVFEGRTFKRDRWERYLVLHGISWPMLDSGRLALDDKTFREMARIHPRLAPMRELRLSLAQMRLAKLAVGRDGRNRCPLWAFGSKTGRNQPSNAAFIFGPAVWLRSLILPEPGRAIAYIDWSQQEFGIAAALSGDLVMWKAYESGDPYLQFAIQAGAAPESATKASHGAVREQFKACALAVQYGMGPDSLALRLGVPVARARQLLRTHREVYSDFWRWSDSSLDFAMLTGSIHTVFGWTLNIGDGANPRAIRNFPMQANGAEMLRLACCLAVERGVQLCAPIHDALLIEANIEDIDERVLTTQQAMADASYLVLDGKRLRADAEIVRSPERYKDPRGEHMWTTVMRLLEDRDVSTSTTTPVHNRTTVLSN